jgi:hypothetical protein
MSVHTLDRRKTSVADNNKCGFVRVVSWPSTVFDTVRRGIASFAFDDKSPSKEDSMNNYVLAGLVAAQMTVAAHPAAAARLEEGTSVQTGTFAGARIRLSLGGKQQDRKFRAGLAVAPTLRSQTIFGETRMQVGEGLELSFTGKRPLAVSLAGRPVSSLLPGAGKPGDDKLELSTGGKVAIGVGAALVVAAGAGYLVMANRCTECDQ